MMMKITFETCNTPASYVAIVARLSVPASRTATSVTGGTASKNIMLLSDFGEQRYVVDPNGRHRRQRHALRAQRTAKDLDLDDYY